MEEMKRLLKILSMNDDKMGLEDRVLIYDYKISENTIKQASSQGLINRRKDQGVGIYDIPTNPFYSKITPKGYDYITTGGAEGDIKRDEENKDLSRQALSVSKEALSVSKEALPISEQTLTVSRKTLFVSILALVVSFLALLATIVIYFLSK